MPRRLQTKRSMLRNGFGNNEEEEESAVPISGLGESEMPQEGHPLDPLRDEAAREILKNLPPREQPSLMNGKELAKDITADVLTRDDFPSGTHNVRRNDLPEEAAVVGEKRSGGKSTSPLGQQSTFDKSMQGTPFTTVVREDPDVEPILYALMNGRADHIRDQTPENWTIHDRQKYHQIELQALLGGPMPTNIQSVVGELGSQSRDGWSRAVIRQVFRPVPRLGFRSAIFKRKRFLGRTSYPTFLDMEPSNPESLELQSLQMAGISVAQRDLHFENLLARPGQVLMTPAHYRLLGARIVVLLQNISELPLLSVSSRPETDTLGEATRLEVEYRLAVIEYMLEVARGFYNNTISLEGKANKTAILFVEFWWWLHRKADYLLRTDLGKRENYPRVPGSSLVSFHRILQDANDWSGRLLFNHLAYAAMRCTDQGFITLSQLLFLDIIDARESLQQIAQHKEASLVQQGPAHDAFVEAVSQQLADRLQSCRQYVGDTEVKLGTDGAVAPITPLTSLPAVITENDPPAAKTQKKAVKNNILVDGVRRSAHIAAACSMAVADLDSTANNKEPAEQTRKLMLLAQACATEDVAKGNKDFKEKQGEEPKLRRQPERPRDEASRYTVGGTIIGYFMSTRE
jgi:hypothetical protein